MAHILLVDDEKVFLRILKRELEYKGHTVTEESDSTKALEQFHRQHFDILILDINMPHQSGYEILQSIRAGDKACIIILVTAFASIEGAVRGMKMGASDYLQKPFDTKILLDKIEQMSKAASGSRRPLTDSVAKHAITQLSPTNNSLMLRIEQTIHRVKNTNATVLITGENGSGKGVAAKMVHYTSDRAEKPFVLLDCASLPESLIESELFGYEKGAFTGAASRQIGKFELAGDGTIFLDEIGVLPQHLQTRLLTVLQERIFYRVGGTERIPMRARVVAATNENLEELVHGGRFREDLYYRLNVVRIDLPPLRFRKEDIIPLAQSMLQRQTQDLEQPLPPLHPEFFEALLHYNWPGNLRELENALESALILCDGVELCPSDLPLRVYRSSTPGTRVGGTETIQQAATRSEMLSIQAALERCGGNRENTAKALGISRRTLQYKLKKYDLLRRDTGAPPETAGLGGG